MRALRTVAASVMITQLRGVAQGQMSHGAVEKSGERCSDWVRDGKNESQNPRSNRPWCAPFENYEGRGSLSRGGARCARPTFFLTDSHWFVLAYR